MRYSASSAKIRYPTTDDDIVMTLNKIAPQVYGDPTTIHALFDIPSNHEFDRD